MRTRFQRLAAAATFTSVCLSPLVIETEALSFEQLAKGSAKRTQRGLAARKTLHNGYGPPFLARNDHQPDASSASAGHVRRVLQEDFVVAGEDDCDGAFMTCLGVDQCVDCFVELQSKEINWASVAKGTPCTDVIPFLTNNGHCESLGLDENAKTTFCQTFDACVDWEDVDGGGASPKNATIDCSALTECNWDGMHTSWIGDGVCQDKVEGCYNTAICNWDGGDCCADTCQNKTYFECGHDGYNCRDPASTRCNSALTNQCNPEIVVPDEDTIDPASIKCDNTLYRVVMYDSFGDGWDDTKITLTTSAQGPANPVYTGSLKRGSQGTDYVCLPIDSTCYHVNVKGGVWGNEVSWEIKPLTDGAPSIAGGGSPMECDFSLTGDACGVQCTGKPNIAPNSDPEYTEFKHMYECITKQCPIQVGACQEDPVCAECFADQSPDYCYAVDSFNAVVDCTLCQCTENKGSDFCEQKQGPGAVIPAAGGGGGGQQAPCSPAEVISGSNAVLHFSQCTNFDQLAITITDFDTNNFGSLDIFESCAHSYKNTENQGGHTALGCLRILFDAMNGADKNMEGEGEGKPVQQIEKIATLLYTKGEEFCDCAKESSDKSPLCPGFVNFKQLLYESLDACQSLDEIDCDAWNEYYQPCYNNMLAKFNQINFQQKEQCEFLLDGCGNVGPYPVFRRLDCGAEIPKAAWDFYDQYSTGCMGQHVPPTPPAPAPVDPAKPAIEPIQPADPSVPQPVPPPAPPPPVPEPKPYVPPDTSSSASKPYVPPEERNKSSYTSPDNAVPRRRAGWFWKLLVVMAVGSIAYYVYKKRQDGFSFVRYRRMRNWGSADSDMYSGLAMESSGGSTSFEPPSLPPPPTAMMGHSGTMG